MLDGELDPVELDKSLLWDCWFLQIREKPVLRLKLPEALGRGNQDTGAHALLTRRELKAMLAEYR